MASITKVGKVYRVQLSVKGVRDSATFSTKKEAMQWALERDEQLRNQSKTGIVTGKTLEDAFDRYEKEVSIHKPGRRWEAIRFLAMGRFVLNGKRLGSYLLSEITPEVLGAYRDKRMSGLKKVIGSTVNREFKLISHVFSIARDEWKWVESSPTNGVRRPKEAAHRQRLFTQDEIDRICMGLGFSEARTPVTTKSAAVAVALLFAIETAMRAGEICNLLAEDIIHDGRVAHVRKSKNGDERDVPLSKRARELLTFLPAGTPTLFNVAAASLDTLFRKVRVRCDIDNLHFHDSRHEAITRLAKKVPVLDLARMTGHRDIKMLMTYYNAPAHSVVDLLG